MQERQQIISLRTFQKLSSCCAYSTACSEQLRCVGNTFPFTVI